jgi:hypothetical protein
MTDANRKYHGGFSVDLWIHRGAWFWRLSGRCCGISTIGSASTENEALGDAQAAVEELSVRCALPAPGRRNPVDRRDLGLSIPDAEDSAAKPENDTGDF